eukprot:TRINITY_DN7415_c0_g1_i1.p1 TRINITY_DN7415_c0_g1~~TRINITY_DN7415_c0_g1_i1.p1  ORF type:complete len:750 (-),score=225.23 TRINITY_DN7415_c0_g1_i1:141-2390(-)
MQLLTPMQRALARLLVVLLAAQSADSQLVPWRPVSYASLNTTVLRARPLPYDPRNVSVTWAIEASCCGYGVFTEELVTKTSYGVGGLFDLPCGRAAEPFVAEWGYEFHNNQQHIFPICGNLTMAAYAQPPADRDDALERLRLYWLCRATEAQQAIGPAAGPVFSMIGHYLYGHLSCSFGSVGVVGSEIGENINSINAHLAASRGAARQFGVPFTIDFSAWMQGYILDYSKAQFWGSASSPVGGHSLSLFRRAYYSAFMSGAGGLIAEAGAVNFFYQTYDSNGLLNLSPLGEIGQAFYKFTHGGAAQPAIANYELIRGIPYVPTALLIEQAHGMGLGFFYQQLAWDVFPLSAPEQRIMAWLQTVWPNSWLVQNQDNTPQSEVDYEVAGPFGEAFDIVVPQNLTAEVLGAYRTVVLTGLGAQVDQTLASTLESYVSSGGVLVLPVDEVTTAASAGWWPPAFLGVKLGDPQFVSAASIRDVETGWTQAANAGGLAPFCVQQYAGGAFYIKTGGDPSKTFGWDGGAQDRCCRSDADTCFWYGTLHACQAALLGSCEPCSSPSAIGCPMWTNGAVSVGTTAVTFDPEQPATTLLEFETPDGQAVPAAVLSSYGSGRVLLLLADDAVTLACGPGGFGVMSHLLDRIENDTWPLVVESNTGEPNGGVQVLANRNVAGWNVTLINNHGVVKQPGQPPVIDPSQARTVTVTLKSNFGTVADIWSTTDGEVSAVPFQGNTFTTVIQPGDVQVLGIQTGR